ncbi:tyrosine-protein phosphatase [Aquibacillus rhizosphaerae]|uniref:Tyrosine-protein phosphatase n=1 Tax=Aquibacillus rhizosphaerae TaxID=3051431 RepID=A0ABT7L047_9BACI|nr:CpsB/CapC family capsule biosynthesis tyrosine phosphatase [Aquibacillus sp. LR5S19]MDL4839113.1 tyrosine protein phosphatase [Aquibacillus sp. LR5S19]
MIDVNSYTLQNTGIEKCISQMKNAADHGIDTIIATSDFDGFASEDEFDVVNYVQDLNKSLLDDNIPITILPGHRIFLSDNIITDLKDGFILPLNINSGFLLVELPADHVPAYFRQLLFDLQVLGYQVIINQPERNKGFIENPDALYELVKCGALSQIATTSIVGKSGKKVQKFTQQLIESNLTHFVASGANTGDNFYLEQAYAQIEKMFGTEKLYLFSENAQAIVDNQSAMIEEPVRIKKSKILGIF